MHERLTGITIGSLVSVLEALTHFSCSHVFVLKEGYRFIAAWHAALAVAQIHGVALQLIR